MDYVFVYKNDGWWLKIDSQAKLLDYHDQTHSKWGDLFSDIINSKEFGDGRGGHASSLAYFTGMYGANRHMSPLRAVLDLRDTVVNDQLSALKEHGEIYINSKGGYHFKQKEGEYSQFVIKDSLIFPEFKEDQIRVSRFPGGSHFYAYIGDMQLRDGSKTKWNTYKAAYEYALSFISEKEGTKNDEHNRD